MWGSWCKRRLYIFSQPAYCTDLQHSAARVVNSLDQIISTLQIIQIWSAQCGHQVWMVWSVLTIRSRLLAILLAEICISVQDSQLAEDVQSSLASASPHPPGSKIDLTVTYFACRVCKIDLTVTHFGCPVYKSQTYTHSCATWSWLEL